jgi:endoglucanase
MGTIRGVPKVFAATAALALILALAPAAVAAPCVPPTQPPGVDPRGVDPNGPNPIAGMPWFVDRDAKAWKSWRHLTRTGRRHKAELMWRLASQPKFAWFGRFSRPNMRKKVREYIHRAACTHPGSVPLMTVMRHQGRSCGGGYAGGGPREDRRTRKWYRQFARAVGGSRVVIAFEPDSLGTIDCLVPSRRDDRLKLLRYGVDVLSQLPNATVYLEAGASDWEPARRTARQLRFIGVRKVRGFMLNVTHHDWTAANIEHGYEISRRVGGKPFVVNTSYNGRGPVHVRRWIDRSRHIWRRINVWCHPLKRGLGPPPNAATGYHKVDAFLWINRPGYSAGSCNGGPLPVGTWWVERALMYAKYATDWVRPPRGTHHGLFKRHTPRQLGYCGDGPCP